MTIAEQEDRLFEEWIKHEQEWLLAEGYFKRKRTVYNLFCYDGLHVTGEPDKSSGYWTMEPDNRQEKLWQEQTIKPLFITKDYNAGDKKVGIDTRYDTGFDNTTDYVYHKFYARYLFLLYGITHITSDGSYPSFEEANNPDLYLENFHHSTAVVRINAKKTAGGKDCPKQVLCDYVSHDKDYILKQIDIYKPNVIVCCDGSDYCNTKESNPIMHLLLKEKYKDAKLEIFQGENSQFIYYSPSYNTVIIHEWHVSMPYISYLDYYEAVPQLARFIKEKHLFFK